MKEDFVPFELAKKLKEKGFNKRVSGYYGASGYLAICNTLWNSNALSNEVSAPTISQVLKWLREEKDIHITIDVDENDNFSFYFTILKRGKESWEVLHYCKEQYDSYEQAAITGIEYTFNNLI